MITILERFNAFVWGVPALILILSVGICLSWRSGFAQFRLLPGAVRSALRPLLGKSKKEDGKIQALCTALAATVGTGNLAGVAGAIALGGPGAVFWMWVCAFLGMITKMAEATLAVRYRRISGSGEHCGGPMYMIMGAMTRKWHWLAYMYCFFGVVASFGVGNGTQINTVVSSINSAISNFGLPEKQGLNLLVGVIMAFVVYRVMGKGTEGIGRAAERLIPSVSLFYVILSLLAILIRWRALPGAFAAIVQGAFSPKAFTGGAVGSLFLSVRVGASRGVFTNEAGMGTASMAHATANVQQPVEQGLMGIVEVFIDTVLICTLTALVILCSGISVPYGQDVGIELTNLAFSDIFGGWVEIFISAALCLFAFATVLGWGLYGMQCVKFLFGEQSVRIYVLLQTIMVIAGSVMRTKTLWLFAETVNGLMAIPNLIVLLRLSGEFAEMVAVYEKRHLPGQVPGNYAGRSCV